MRKRVLTSILLSTSIFGLISLGFSSWLTVEQNQANVNLDNIFVDQIETQNVLTYNGSNTFVISKDGIVENETIVSECGLTFNFTIDNSMILPLPTNIIYTSTLTMTGLNSSMATYLKNPFVSVNSINQANGTLGAYASNKQTYTHEISVPISGGETGKTQFGLTYTFTGNFYSILSSGGLTCNVNLKAK